jgi:hypothetical protein
MRKLALYFALVLAFALALSAQEAGAAKAKSSTNKADKTHQVTGCLSGPNDEGAYVLTNMRHRKGIEVGGNDDLKNHVGHKVQLTGTWGSAADIAENPKNAAEEKSERHLKVSSIKMLSDTCHATAATSHPKKQKKAKTQTPST